MPEPSPSPYLNGVPQLPDEQAALAEQSELSAEEERAIAASVERIKPAVRAARHGYEAGKRKAIEDRRTRPLSPHQKKRALALLAAGRNWEQVAKLLQVSPRSVERIARGVHKAQSRYERCLGCGGKVIANRPCLKCKIDKQRGRN